MVPLDHYELVWPKASFKNKVVSNVKTKFYDTLCQGVKADELKMHGTQTWRNAGYDHVDQVVTKKMDRFLKSKKGKELMTKIHNRAKRGSKSDSIKSWEIEAFWTSGQGYDILDLNRFIKDTLLKHHKNDVDKKGRPLTTEAND